MAEQQKVEIYIGDGYTRAQRKRIAKELIDVMVDRSKDGIGIYKAGRGYTTKPFPGYSTSYVKSLDFAIAGKSRGNVNLTLSGDMLAAIELLDDKGDTLVIGFEDGTEENERAEGNQLGSYGRSPNRQKARPFLGVTRDELEQVLRSVDGD